MNYQVKKNLAGGKDIVFTCANCGSTIELNLSKAGEAHRCDSCGDVQQVPGESLLSRQKQLLERAKADKAKEIEAERREKARRKAGFAPDAVLDQSEKTEIQKRIKEIESKQTSEAASRSGRNPPKVGIVVCPYCRSDDIKSKRRQSTQGFIAIAIGLLLLPAFGLGFIFIIGACFMWKTSHYCRTCRSTFGGG